MFQRFFGKGMKTPDLSGWNATGREIAAANCAQIAAFHAGLSDGPKLITDTRGPALAEAVLQQVIALNNAGRGAEARGQFDPAHAPFVAEMKANERGLSFCAIIAPDEYLVQQGATYQPNTTWHIQGETIRALVTCARPCGADG